MKQNAYYYFENILNTEQIKEINQIVENKSHGLENPNDGAKTLMGEYKKSSIVKKVKYKFLKEKLENVVEGFIKTNTNEYGYDLFPLTGNDELRYNIYSSENKSKYDWHIDISRRQINDAKLTILINLSESFTGGEFFLYPGHEVIAKPLSNPGTAICFKSDILHKVEPVTSGIRKTLTIFLEGPNWK